MIAYATLMGVAFRGRQLALAADAVGEARSSPNMTAIVMFFDLRASVDAFAFAGPPAEPRRPRTSTRRRRHLGFPERFRHCRRLHVRGNLLELSLTQRRGWTVSSMRSAFFVGWPVILFLIAERLRNLGSSTFADIASYRLDQNRIRTFAAFGSLTVVCFPDRPDGRCRPAPIKLLFGLDYPIAVTVVGVLMVVRHLRRDDRDDLRRSSRPA